MILIHLYIFSYKHLRHLNIPLHGGFKCECNNNKISLQKSKTLDSYYDGLSIQGIIGKNGVGKSTILDLICNNKPDYHQQYIIIWHDNETGYTIQSNYHEPSHIYADEPYSLDASKIENLISLVNINNISPPFSYARENSSGASFFTPSTYKSYDANRRKQSKILSNYFSSSIHYADDLRPKYFLSFKKLKEDDIFQILKLIKKDEKAYTFFIDSMSSYGQIQPDNIFPAIKTFSSNLAMASLYLTVSLQLTKTYQHLGKLNPSYQHCAGLMLFITIIKNQDYDFESSFFEWRDIFYNRFIEIEWGSINDVKINNKMPPLSNRQIKRNINDINDVTNDIYYYFQKTHPYDAIETESSIKIYVEHPEKIQWLTSKIERSYFSLGSIFDYGWDGLSSGELAKAMLLANIFWYIKNSNATLSHIILIDEIDLYLHPEWQRNIINDIISLVKNEVPNARHQFIITSHSPIIISDLLPENIVNINKHPNGEVIISESPGYASQISDLYMSGMHISSTFGERVHSTLTKIIDKKGVLSDEDKMILDRIRSKNIRQLLGAK